MCVCVYVCVCWGKHFFVNIYLIKQYKDFYLHIFVFIPFHLPY